MTGEAKMITPEMVQRSVGKFGADIPWCKAVASNLNAQLEAALAQQTPASQIGIPARELLMKVAQSWIHTGLTGTGLRNDEGTGLFKSRAALSRLSRGRSEYL